MSLFDIATRQKFRFNTPQGNLTVEDLWDLPLSSSTGKANLDAIAIALHKQLETANTTSFVNTPAKADPSIQQKFDVVKHIIDVRLEENKAAAEAREKAAQKQRILERLARKGDEKLDNASEDELKAMLAAL